MSIEVCDSEYGYAGGLDGHESRWRAVIWCSVHYETGDRFHAWDRDQKLSDWIDDHRNDLFVAHNMVAEVAYLLRLGIVPPTNWFDTMLAYRYVSCQYKYRKIGLSDALRACGLKAWIPHDKDKLREMIGKQSYDPSDPEVLRDIRKYCFADCEATRVLYRALEPLVPQRSMKIWTRFAIATARMELRGIPLDMKQYTRILNDWPRIRDGLTEEVNRVCPGAYEGSTFKLNRLVNWAAEQGLRWPTKWSPAKKALYYTKDDDTLKYMGRHHPVIRRIRSLEKAKRSFAKRDMVIDEVTGRHHYRSMLLGSKTGRNTNRKWILGGAKWWRHLIVPESPNHLTVNADYTAQEFAIAAYLSKDEAMIEAYRSSDCHMSFVIMAGAAPRTATKKTHPDIRDQYKTCNLGLLYGQGAQGMASRLGCAVDAARDLIATHKRIYPTFWAWQDRMLDGVYTVGRVNTRHGWQMAVDSDVPETCLKNWAIQATGGDIMRLTVIYLDQQNVKVLAPVHDGFLISCRKDQLDDCRAAIDCACQWAVDQTLPGCPMRCDVAVYEKRYEDDDGRDDWEWIQRHLGSTPMGGAPE